MQAIPTESQDDRPLTHLLDAVAQAADREVVTVRDVISEIGDRSITPFILMIALLLVSPISGIPMVPTITAVIICLLSAQALLGRKRLWLPAFLMDRAVAGRNLKSAVAWLRRPAAWIDRHSHPRLQFLTVGPMRFLTLLQCTIIPLGWPALEILPTVTSFGAGTIALLVFGLFTRDGLYVLAGYCVSALMAVVILLVVRGWV